MNKRYKILLTIFVISCYFCGYQLGRLHTMEPSLNHNRITLEAELSGATKMMRLIQNDFQIDQITYDTTNISAVLYTNFLIKQLEIMEGK